MKKAYIKKIIKKNGLFKEDDYVFEKVYLLSERIIKIPRSASSGYDEVKMCLIKHKNKELKEVEKSNLYII
jgi:hypothetical protein